MNTMSEHESSDDGFASIATPALSHSSSFTHSSVTSRRASVVSFQYSSSEEEDERTARRQAWRSPRRSRNSSLNGSQTTSPILSSRPLPSPTFANTRIFPHVTSINALPEEVDEEEAQYLTFEKRSKHSSRITIPTLPTTTKPFRTPRPKHAVPPHRRRSSKYIFAPRREQQGWKETLVACTPARLEWVLKAVLLIGVSVVVVGMLVGSYVVSLFDDVRKWARGLNRVWVALVGEKQEERTKEEEGKRPAILVLIPTVIIVFCYAVARFALDSYTRHQRARAQRIER